ncbi:MAG: AI-2E family transporter [Alicyclobacillus sp.]|nr:AI-2E family transporter [Alicyclobacillus sp.]
MDTSSRYFRGALTVLVTLACFYLFAELRSFFHDIWDVVKGLVIPFLAAMVCTYVLQPVVEALVKRRVPRSMAILIIYLAFILLLVVGILHAIPLVSRQLTQLTQHLPTLIQQADSWIDGLARRRQYLPDALRRGIESALSQAEQNMAAYAASVITMLTGTVNAVLGAFVVPFLVFYMLKDARAIGRAMVHLAPPGRREQVREILSGIDETLGKYVRGQLLVMLTVGILTYAGLLLVRMPYALLLALFVAMTNIIPYLGPFIGATPAILLAFSISPQMALKVILVNVIVQQCEGNLISPQIMGRTLNLHPMSIVAALLLGGEMAGVLGLVVAVPALAVGKVVWLHVRGKGPGGGGGSGRDGGSSPDHPGGARGDRKGGGGEGESGARAGAGIGGPRGE